MKLPARLITPVLISLFAFLFIKVPAFAQSTDSCLGTITDFGCIPNDPVGFVGKFYGIGLGFIGCIALLGIIYAGYLILTSAGNPTQLEKGKRYLYSSIAGILLAIFAFVFIEVIAVNILQIPGFGH
jgi:hypothetical protein